MDIEKVLKLYDQIEEVLVKVPVEIVTLRNCVDMLHNISTDELDSYGYTIDSYEEKGHIQSLAKTARSMNNALCYIARNTQLNAMLCERLMSELNPKYVDLVDAKLKTKNEDITALVKSFYNEKEEEK